MSTAPPTYALWTAHDVAAYLKASVSYVYKAAERGELPCRRLGALLRFIPEEVRAWAEQKPASGRRRKRRPSADRDKEVELSSGDRIE